MKKGFENFLVKQGYKLTTPSGNASTVYDYLKYVPIALKDIFYTRVQYLLRFIVRRLILLYLIQGIWFVVRKHIAWKVTVIPVCYMFFVFLVILLEIKPNNTRKR